jgi:hypothetical protein
VELLNDALDDVEAKAGSLAGGDLGGKKGSKELVLVLVFDA